MTIGIFGLGLVGMALAERLLAAGAEVLGFDPDPARAALLGSRASATPGAVLARSRTVILAVYDADQLESLLFGAEAWTGAPTTFLCVTTATPSRIADIEVRLAGLGHALVECPLSGTSAQIRRGEATALVAGEPTARSAADRILTILCPRRLELGSAGDAARVKLGINLVLQLNRAALAEGLAFAAAVGLDPGAFLAALTGSAAYSAVMAGKGPKMVARDYAPESHIAQTLKDADMILEEAAGVGQPLPLMTAQRVLLRQAVALVGQGADSAAVLEAIRPMAAP